jgi:arabinose-5-phosphate isomerase
MAGSRESSINLLERTAADIMTRKPLTVRRGTLAVEVLRIFEERKITSIIVVDAEGNLDGVVHMHDLWRTEMF